MTLSLSDHVQVWSGRNCLRLAQSVCSTKETYWMGFSGGCSLSLIQLLCQLGSEWMKNITGYDYANHKLLLLLIFFFWSLCHCSAIVVHVSFVFFWLGRRFFLLVCFVLLKSSVEPLSHEHFVTHIAFLYCTRVGDHVPSVEEMSESHWLYFRWHCAFLDTTLTWCLAFFHLCNTECVLFFYTVACCCCFFAESAVHVPQLWVYSLILSCGHHVLSLKKPKL